MAFQAQDRTTNNPGNKADNDCTHHQSRHRRPAIGAGCDTGEIGTETKESGMPQADLPGVTNQKIQANDRCGNDRYLGDQLIMERVAQKSRKNDKNQGENNQPSKTRLHKGIQHQTRSTTLAPNKPRGRKNSTSRIMEKATASL